MLLEFSPSSFQSLQEYPKRRRIRWSRSLDWSFQSLQEYPKRYAPAGRAAARICFQSLQEYPKRVPREAGAGDLSVSNPYRNILSFTSFRFAFTAGASFQSLQEYPKLGPPGAEAPRQAEFPILTGIS